MNLRTAITASPALPLCACLAIIAGGCSSLLAAKPDASRYWVLGSNNATAGALAGSEPVGARRGHIGLGPITLPEYLKDRRVLVRSGANQIEAMPHDYWAEPLESGFPRALVYDVSQSLRTASALLYPWYSSKRVQWSVPIDVLQFETSSSGEVLLVARWRVVEEPEGDVVFASESRIAEPVTESGVGDPTGARVAALRRSITRLATQIAAEVEKRSRPAPVPTARKTAPKADAAKPQPNSEATLPGAQPKPKAPAAPGAPGEVR